MALRDMAAALAIMVIWGFNFVVAKWALAEFPPVFAMFLRFALVAAMLVPLVRVPRERLVGIGIFGVLLGGIHFPMMFRGLTQVDASTASIAIQLQVPFAAMMAAVVFKDRPTWRQVLGMAIAFGGVVVIAGEPRLSASLVHLALIVGASFVFAIANIHVKRMGPVDVFALNGWMSLFAAPLLLGTSLATEQGQWEALGAATWLGWASILYMVVLVTGISYGLWYPLLTRYDVSQTMPWTLTVPIFGVLSGVLVLGDPLTPALILGGALTLVGVALIVLRPKRAVEPAAGSTT
ncbi:DMT family transporter [Arenibaculum pallidiluteum]|uniref:DMT family transporter n=1 Tax=Arenibaculum pallidiluteum TaxID=2812559 RepID=UPI001A975EA2|nr:EamA family transporter [Arenibaculum pallidiluteum]